MTIPVYLVVAQWVLLLVLGMLVVLMFRQLAHQLTVTRAPRALGPAAGSRAAGFSYTRLDNGREDFFEPGGGKASLIAFADPTCPSCEELAAALNAAAAEGDLAEVRPLLLTSEPPSYLQISSPFRQTPLPLGRIGSDAALRAYRVSATPLLVAIDRAGVVRAAGPATGLPEVRAYLRACLSPVPGGATLPVAPAGFQAPRPERAAAGEDR